nr:MAG TPA: hypothetical protein [Caudoviricetes sp.]
MLSGSGEDLKADRPKIKKTACAVFFNGAQDEITEIYLII